MATEASVVRSCSSDHRHSKTSDVLLFLDNLMASVKDDVLLLDAVRQGKMERSACILCDSVLSNIELHQTILKITDALRQIVRESITRNSLSWKTLWQKFHAFRKELLLIMCEELADMTAQTIDPILIQSASESLLLAMAKEGESQERSIQEEASTVQLRDLTLTEECAVMYCGGFVVGRLTKKYSKERREVAGVFTRVLQSLCATDFYDTDSDDFDSFVKKWIMEVNRGGLKILSADSFNFFKLLERVIYAYIVKNTRINGSAIVEGVVANEDLQFLWCMLATDIDQEEYSNELLSDIAKLWIKIRGHSHTSALLEKYELLTSQPTKQVKEIRKALKMK